MNLRPHLRRLFRFGGFDSDKPSFGDGMRERLFAVNVLAHPQRHDRGLRMTVIGGADDDGIEVFGFLDHLAEVVELGGAWIFFSDRAEQAIVDVAEGDDVFRRDALEVFATAVGDTDHADIQLFIRPRGAHGGGRDPNRKPRKCGLLKKPAA